MNPRFIITTGVMPLFCGENNGLGMMTGALNLNERRSDEVIEVFV
jgi:hypothetical protein